MYFLVLSATAVMKPISSTSTSQSIKVKVYLRGGELGRSRVIKSGKTSVFQPICSLSWCGLVNGTAIGDLADKAGKGIGDGLFRFDGDDFEDGFVVVGDYERFSTPFNFAKEAQHMGF